MRKFVLKDPGSAITHLIGLLSALIGTIPLLAKAFIRNSPVALSASVIYLLSLILLYGASSLYHSLDLSKKVNRRLKKFDHMMIFILIAGTYTPICLLTLEQNIGLPLLVAVWLLAFIGICFKAFWVTCPKWLSSVIYVGMGWTCIFAFPQIYHSLPFAGFLWLLLGGLIYTVGAVIYAMKHTVFDSCHTYFGSHEIFHLFVMAGSLCHYIVIYGYVV